MVDYFLASSRDVDGAGGKSSTLRSCRQNLWLMEYKWVVSIVFAVSVLLQSQSIRYAAFQKRSFLYDCMSAIIECILATIAITILWRWRNTAIFSEIIEQTFCLIITRRISKILVGTFRPLCLRDLHTNVMSRSPTQLRVKCQRAAVQYTVVSLVTRMYISACGMHVSLHATH